MSGIIWRWKKVRDMTATANSAAVWVGRRSISSLNCNQHYQNQNQNENEVRQRQQQRSGLANRLNGHGRRREMAIGIGGVQERRYKWEQGGGSNSDQSGSNEARRLRAVPNCPRCASHIDLFSMNNLLLLPPSSSSDEEDDPKAGTFKEVSVCPSCKAAYFFKPYSSNSNSNSNSTAPPPLQGCFVEIGKLKSRPPHCPSSPPIIILTMILMVLAMAIVAAAAAAVIGSGLPSGTPLGPTETSLPRIGLRHLGMAWLCILLLVRPLRPVLISFEHPVPRRAPAVDVGWSQRRE